jgi:hypothetical protein
MSFWRRRKGDCSPSCSARLASLYGHSVVMAVSASAKKPSIPRNPKASSASPTDLAVVPRAPLISGVCTLCASTTFSPWLTASTEVLHRLRRLSLFFALPHPPPLLPNACMLQNGRKAKNSMISAALCWTTQRPAAANSLLLLPGSTTCCQSSQRFPTRCLPAFFCMSSHALSERS